MLQSIGSQRVEHNVMTEQGHLFPRLSSLFLTLFFSVCCCDWVSSSALLLSAVTLFFPASSGLLLNLHTIFSISVIVFFSSVTSIWCFLLFSASVLRFSLCPSIFLLSLVNIFITILLYFYQVNHLSLFH